MILNFLSKTLSSNKKLFVVLLFALLILLTPFKFLSLLACVVLWSLVWPFPYSINSHTLRVALSFCLTSSFVQMSGIVLWLFGIRHSVELAVILQVAVILILSFKKSAPKKIPLYNRADVVASLTALLSFILIGVGSIHSPVTQNLLQASTNGFDDTIHTSLSMTVYDEEGYVYGKSDDVIERIKYKALVAYPQGWHLSSTLWWHSVSDNITENPSHVMFAYILSKLVWFTLIVFLFCRAILHLISYRRKSSLSFTELVGSSALTLITELIFLFGIYRFGFSSFFPVLVFLLALLFFLPVINDRSESRIRGSLISAAFLSGGISLSWLLAAPLGYAATVLSLLDRFSFRTKDSLVWIKQNLRTVLIVALISALGASQLLVEILYNENDDLINNDGGIWQFSHLFFFFLLICAPLIISKLKSFIAKPQIYLISTALILTGFVYSYQYATAGRPSYYSTKVSYLPLLLLLVYVSVYAIMQLDKISHDKGRLVALMTIVGFTATLPLALDINLSIAGDVFGLRDKLTNSSAAAIAPYMKNIREDITVVLKNRDYEEDVIVTNYLNMYGYRPENTATTCRGSITWLQISNDDKGLMDMVEKCAASNTSTKFRIITNSEYFEALGDRFEKFSNIEVILTK